MITSFFSPPFTGRAAPQFGYINGAGMPRQYLLGRFPFMGEDGQLPSEDYQLPSETSWLGSVTLPESYFAIMGVGPFFTDSGVPINVPQVLVEDWISTNSQPMHWWIYRHWLYVYDPYLITDAIADKCARVVRESASARSGVLHYKTPTKFFNGFDFTNCTYTGGILPEFDNSGALVSPGVNIPSIRGARLATTVAYGAMLGPELVNINIISSIDSSGGGNGNYNTSTHTLSNTVIGSSTSYPRFRFYTGTRTINEKYKCEVVFSDSSKVTDVRLALAGVTQSLTKNGDIYSGTIVADNNGSVIDITTKGTSVWSISILSFSVKRVIPTYYDTDTSGNRLNPSTLQPTRIGNADFTTFTVGPTFKDYAPSDPANWGWLCAPARTNYALNSATPATQTTTALAVGTYTLWQEGTGSVVATAGTAVGTFGTASNGNPATITITTTGTVVLTVSGTNTWLQLELGAFKTPRISTTTAPATRAGTVASHPTAGYIRSTDMAMRMIVVPRATGQSTIYLYGTYVDANNYTAIVVTPTSVILRKMVAGVQTDATVSYTHSNGVPVEVVTVRSSVGMRIAVRQYSGGAWSAWTLGTLNSATGAKTAAQIGTTYQLGSLNSANQFYGNIEEFEPLLIPPGTADPMAWAMAAYDRTNTDTQINVSPDEFLINDETFINDSTTMFA